jgi:pyruvate/2-oxoglutarate dehydrogenase complex dihydrolipoamide dehydrogenase (E3) component
MTTIAKVAMPPMDEHNQALVNNVHPPDWVNPTPSGRYNLVVIGAGTAGLVTAIAAAGLGAKVALIERHLMGGDCLNVGCVPSKMLIRCGRSYADVRDAGEFGVRVPEGTHVDFAAVMERMRKLRSGISKLDSAHRFTENGVDVYIGQASFSGSDTVEVAGQTLRFKKAVIATGARAFEPPTPGLKEAGFLTNETVFSLTECPPRLAVIGGGPIGCELAQSFQRLGSQVIQVEMAQHVLIREDADAAAVVQASMLRDGVDLKLNAKLDRVSVENGAKRLHLRTDSGEETVDVDEILVGVGRVPNVDGLNLEGVGVEYDPKDGVKVDDRLRTTNPRIYAAGDICMKYKFTHAADAAARIVIANTLFFGRSKVSALTVPWCTYTDPELAHVGLSAHGAHEQGIEIDSYTVPFDDVDRAIAEGDTEGFLKIHTYKGKDQIAGATIVGRHAGEMISEITLAMTNGVGLKKINNVIHPYPTTAECIRKAAGAYMRTKLTPGTKRFLERFMAWQR